MAIFYNVVQRKNPSKPTDPMQWYIVLRRVEQTDEEDVAIEIADETTLNPHEARMSIEQMKKVLIRNLLNGHSVRVAGVRFISPSQASPRLRKKKPTPAR